MSRAVAPRFLLPMWVLFMGLSLGGCGINNIPSYQETAKARWSDVQNQYQRRADLIPNLVNTVSGAANFEKSTLTEVTQARASVGQVQVNPNSAPRASGSQYGAPSPTKAGTR